MALDPDSPVARQIIDIVDVRNDGVGYMIEICEGRLQRLERRVLPMDEEDPAPDRKAVGKPGLQLRPVRMP